MAEAWVQPRGHGQIITSYSADSAQNGFSASGQATELTQDWKNNSLQVYGEYGVSDKVTFVVKAQIQNLDTIYEQGTLDGPYEVGVKYRLWQNDNRIVSVGFSAEGFSRSHRNSFDTKSASGNDFHASLAAGQSFDTRLGKAFVEASVAHISRQTESDQWRYGLTYGLKSDASSMWLLQGFGGLTEKHEGQSSQWHMVQASYVRALNNSGDLKGQLGLKYTIAGNNVPAMGGFFVAIWKQF